MFLIYPSQHFLTFQYKKNYIVLSWRINCMILKAKTMFLKRKCLTPEVFREQTFHLFTHFSLATQMSDFTCPITSFL